MNEFLELSAEEETVLIGQVLKPQGLNGELKVYPLTDDPRRFLALGEVRLRGAGTETEVLPVRQARISGGGKMVYLTLAGIDSPETAAQYRGFEVRVPRAQAAPLAPGRWYYYELEGMDVFDGGVWLGKLERILETGANDVYIVRGEAGEICVPALKTVVRRVDVPGRRMDVDLPPGLR
ncbi:MAG: ribosome maturation factor RimM [Gracilibacteraceae bacterium]|jgi:16S rRNA processing protein RimM|nr:ribosome maturation factor RimM [Gracilibacteraceae bacterium]